MRQRIIENLPRGAGDSDALAPVQRERFLVYLTERQVQFDPLDVRALVGRGTPAQSRGDRARIGVPKRPEPETLTVVTR